MIGDNLVYFTQPFVENPIYSAEQETDTKKHADKPSKEDTENKKEENDEKGEFEIILDESQLLNYHFVSEHLFSLPFNYTDNPKRVISPPPKSIL